jgi:hypothetical protein
MALDPVLAAGVQPVQFDNPMNQLAQVLQIQQAQKQGQLADLNMQTAQRGFDEQNKLLNYFASNDPKSESFARGLYAISPQKGMDYDKMVFDRRKDEAEIKAKEATTNAAIFKLATDREQGYKSTLVALHDNPNLSKPLAVAAMQSKLQQGLITPEMFAHITNDLPDDPSALRQQLLLGVKELLTPEQKIILFAPKPVEQTDGQVKTTIDQNPLSPTYGKPTGAPAVQMMATPGEVMTDARARQQMQQTKTLADQAVTYQQDGNGNFVALPSKVVPGGIVSPIAVLGSDGKPIQGKNNLPVEFNKSITGIKELTNALDSYQKTLADNGGASALAMGARRGNLQGSYTALQMGLKNAFELGALAGPDLTLLQGMLVDPTSPRGMLLGNEGIAAQIKQVKQYIKNRGAAVYEGHRQPVPLEFAKEPSAPARLLPTLPPADSSNRGKRARDTETGKVYKSNGTTWMEE